MKPLLLFIFLCIVGLAITSGLVIINEETCPNTEILRLSDEKKSVQPPSAHKHTRPNERDVSTKPLAAINKNQPIDDAKNNNAPKADADKNWWNKFRCELKIGDVIISYFTFCLVLIGAFQAWWLWRTVKSAEESSKAMIAVESPRLVLSGLKLVRDPGPDGEPPEDPISGAPYGDIRPLLSITNDGRTSTMISQVCIDWAVTKKLPDSPYYRHISGMSLLLRPSEGTWINNSESGFRLSEGELKAIQHGEAHLWIYGYVSHINHLNNERITLGFASQWSSHQAAFINQGPKTYNYEKRESTAPA